MYNIKIDKCKFEVEYSIRVSIFNIYNSYCLFYDINTIIIM